MGSPLRLNVIKKSKHFSNKMISKLIFAVYSPPVRYKIEIYCPFQVSSPHLCWLSVVPRYLGPSYFLIFYFIFYPFFVRFLFYIIYKAYESWMSFYIGIFIMVLQRTFFIHILASLLISHTFKFTTRIGTPLNIIKLQMAAVS